MTARPERAAALALAALWPGAAGEGSSVPTWRPDVAAELSAHRALDAVRAGATLAPFATDGCSGGLSAVWASTAAQFPAFAAAQGARPPWEGCCVIHDLAYHAGGPGDGDRRGFAARLAADEALGVCVRAALGDRAFGLPPAAGREVALAVAEAMVLAVRLGGAPCTGLPWRWGYGWPDCSPFDGD